jgi:hypothetical protein
MFFIETQTAWPILVKFGTGLFFEGGRTNWITLGMQGGPAAPSVQVLENFIKQKL